MYERGRSDSPVVPAKPPSNAGPPAAEVVEGRGLAEGDTTSTTRPGHRAGPGVSRALDRVREVARQDRGARFTALVHHVDVACLRVAYWAIRPRAAPGVEGQTWEAYGQDLEANLHDLHTRLHTGRCRASSSRRVYIPKVDGRLRSLGRCHAGGQDRPVGVSSRYGAPSTRWTPLGFSYGFRPGRNPHHAVDALAVGISRKKVNRVLDADIREFFTSLDHRWLMKCLEHRIAGQRVLRLIRERLSAGVIEDGAQTVCDEGAPQGASASPLPADVYLHDVGDLWAPWWRRHYARGDVIIVRFAGDIVAGVEDHDDAQRFLTDLRERLATFGWGPHPDKPRLIEFGWYAARRRAARGLGKPETFDVLGFTHLCGKTKTGRFWLRRITISKRMRAKLRVVNDHLKPNRHRPVPVHGQRLRAVVQGHLAYYAVPGHTDAVAAFRTQVTRHWYKVLRRRSRRTRINWTRMNRIAQRWLPPARVRHPFPNVRFDVRTRGRSPVREQRTLGSARRAARKGGSYRDQINLTSLSQGRETGSSRRGDTSLSLRLKKERHYQCENF